MNLVEPYLAALRKNSDARIATNQDFIYIRQDIEQFGGGVVTPRQLINGHDALKEHERTFLQSKARDAYVLAAQTSMARQIYDITGAKFPNYRG